MDLDPFLRPNCTYDLVAAFRAYLPEGGPHMAEAEAMLLDIEAICVVYSPQVVAVALPPAKRIALNG